MVIYFSIFGFLLFGRRDPAFLKIEKEKKRKKKKKSEERKESDMSVASFLVPSSVIFDEVELFYGYLLEGNTDATGDLFCCRSIVLAMVQNSPYSNVCGLLAQKWLKKTPLLVDAKKITKNEELQAEVSSSMSNSYVAGFCAELRSNALLKTTAMISDVMLCGVWNKWCLKTFDVSVCSDILSLNELGQFQFSQLFVRSPLNYLQFVLRNGFAVFDAKCFYELKKLEKYVSDEFVQVWILFSGTFLSQSKGIESEMKFPTQKTVRKRTYVSVNPNSDESEKKHSVVFNEDGTTKNITAYINPSFFPPCITRLHNNEHLLNGERMTYTSFIQGLEFPHDVSEAEKIKICTDFVQQEASDKRPELLRTFNFKRELKPSSCSTMCNKDLCPSMKKLKEDSADPTKVDVYGAKVSCISNLCRLIPEIKMDQIKILANESNNSSEITGKLQRLHSAHLKKKEQRNMKQNTKEVKRLEKLKAASLTRASKESTTTTTTTPKSSKLNGSGSNNQNKLTFK